MALRVRSLRIRGLVRRPKVRAFPKVRELFKRILADHQKIALASAKGDELDNYKRRAHIEDLFDAKTSSDDAEHSQPNPDIFLAACHHRACVLKRPSSWATARIMLKPEDWLRSAGCDVIYREPADLLDRYDQSPIARASALG